MEHNSNENNDQILFQKKNPKKTIILVSSIVLAVALIIGAVIFISEENRIRQEKEALLQQEIALKKEQQDKQMQYEKIMYSGTYPEGVAVNDIPLGGLTKKEAKEKLTELLGTILPNGYITCTYNGTDFTFDLSTLKTKHNMDEILQLAYTAAQDDDQDTAIQKANEIAQNGLSYTLDLDVDYTALDNFINEIKSTLDVSAKNASIESVDTENHTVTTSSSVKGLSVNDTTLRDALMTAISNKNYQNIEIPVEEIIPTNIDENFSMIEITAETSFKGSNSNRVFNIQKGAGIINGTVLAPGAIFSANETLGVRSYNNGWKEANAYVGGTTDPQAGGGVCQLSSTLYNAVVKADLEVVYRRNHSMPVNYIAKGLDATINSVGNMIDFKFSNNTNSDIVIFSWTEGKNLFFKIMRVPFATDEYDEIRLTAEKIEDLHPTGEMEIIPDETLLPGEEVIDVERKDGSVYQSYKNFYKAGSLVRSEKLALSTYSAFNGVMRVSLYPADTSTLDTYDDTAIDVQESSDVIIID